MIESVQYEVKGLHCNSDIAHCKVFIKNVINCLSDFLCVSKVLNVVLMLIFWYLNQRDVYF